MRLLLFSAVLSGILTGQTFEGMPSLTLSNDRLEVVILKHGGSLVSLVDKADTTKLNPLWIPARHQNGGFGHFLCVDGFGPTSKEEAAAGLPGHGEAIRTQFEVLPGSEGASSVSLAAVLPLVQERVVRSYELKPGENVLYVRTRLESQVAFDRPIAWAEHATIGSPVLERAVTAVDISGTRSQTRPWEQEGTHQLPSGKDFTWPTAPLQAGGTIDLRTAPADPMLDHITTLNDASKPYAWATAVNPRLRRIVGWIWRPGDYAWLQTWMHYPKTGVLARGLEFSTQPYDVSRRNAVSMSPMFDTPTFRWLPGKSAIETVFAVFSAAVPEGFNRVEGMDISAGNIVLRGPGGTRVEVKASLPF